MKQSAHLENEHGNYLEVNGLQMYYESYGEGIPVILIHGGLETCRMWKPVVDALSRKYRVITPDSRGHGRTDESVEKISYVLMTEDIVQLIYLLGLERPFVSGYSDGGRIALGMAMNYPRLARGYMIGGIFRSMTLEWRQTMQNQLGFEGPGNVDYERIAQIYPDTIKLLQEKHDVHHAPGYWKTLLMQSSKRWWDPPVYSEADYAGIVEPTLFWCGDRDVFCPPEQSLEMYRMVKGAELAIIPNADHFSMMQQIDIANLISVNFMNRVIQYEKR